MKRFLLILFVLAMLCDSAYAYKIYSYDGHGNRIYYRVDPSQYAVNKSRKYAHIYETRGPRHRKYYSKEDRDRYYARLEQNRCRYR